MKPFVALLFCLITVLGMTACERRIPSMAGLPTSFMGGSEEGL